MEPSTSNEEYVLINSNCPQKQLLIKILKVLECPVCLETFKCQVYMCENGHNICGICRMFLDNQCPVCREARINNRNIVVESVLFEYNIFRSNINCIAKSDRDCTAKLNTLSKAHNNYTNKLKALHQYELTEVKKQLEKCKKELSETVDQFHNTLINSTELKDLVDNLQLWAETLEEKANNERLLRIEAEAKLEKLQARLEKFFLAIRLTEDSDIE